MMDNNRQLDVNVIVDEVLQKYSVLLKESAMKTAYIKQLEEELKLANAPTEDGN